MMKKDLPYIAFLLSIFIVSFNRGFFTLPTFALLTCLLFILIYLYVRPVKVIEKYARNRLKILFLITFLLFLYFSGGIYQSNFIPTILIDLLPLLFFPLVLYIMILPEQ